MKLPSQLIITGCLTFNVVAAIFAGIYSSVPWSISFYLVGLGCSILSAKYYVIDVCICKPSKVTFGHTLKNFQLQQLYFLVNIGVSLGGVMVWIFRSAACDVEDCDSSAVSGVSAIILTLSCMSWASINIVMEYLDNTVDRLKGNGKYEIGRVACMLLGVFTMLCGVCNLDGRWIDHMLGWTLLLTGIFITLPTVEAYYKGGFLFWLVALPSVVVITLVVLGVVITDNDGSPLLTNYAMCSAAIGLLSSLTASIYLGCQSGIAGITSTGMHQEKSVDMPKSHFSKDDPSREHILVSNSDVESCDVKHQDQHLASRV